MTTAELIRALAAAGAPAEAIALAVDAVEAARAPDAARRAAERDRKRRQRARAAGADLFEGDAEASFDAESTPSPEGRATGGACPATDAPRPATAPDTGADGPALLPPDGPPPPQTPPPPLNPPTRNRRGRGERLIPRWQPAPLPMPEADMVALWPAGRLERELARFRDHWAAAAGANARKHDWDAAWRNWLRKADDETPRNPRRTGRRAGNAAPERGAGSDAAAGSFDPGGPELADLASPLVRAGLARLRHAGGAG
ncbi:hypothetical protein ACFOMD_01970 [Sphingoaurantiacus capsulatus]|uniref:Uncharacterized protein n=1 Tax=Sphingoaurantiacus capsulatus TaxID=1771310 RepID=A0ABV7X6F7_9SPHN